MRSIIRFSLNNKFALWLFTLIVVASGIYSGLTMKQESLPNLALPYLSVTTVYPGSSPDSVVKEITAPLEQRLENVSSVKNRMSTSMENVSNIMIEFDYGQDMNQAAAEVREAIAEFRLPEGAQTPSISKFSFSSLPVLSLSVSDAGGMGLESLTKIVTDDIAPALQALDGVASVQLAGQYVKEVTIDFDEAKMAELGLAQETVQGIIQGSALHAPLGLYTIGRSEAAVAVDGQVKTLEDLKNVEIPIIPGAGAGEDAALPPEAEAGWPGAGLPTVKLSDIAAVELVGKAESVSRTDGRDSIGIQLVKANDANTVEVVNAVKQEIRAFEQKYDGLKLDVIFDQGEPVEDSVKTMLDKALYGALFAVIVILLFLRNVRTTIISVISIPLSIIIALLLLRQFDITLNMMTLGAMSVAIGRVVDDSIVVIENIYRRMSLKGEKLQGKELIVEATREMFLPIMSSTIVTIAVFLPLGLVTGMVGELFMPFALTIVFALLASLLVAISVVPMFGHSLFRNGIKESRKRSHAENSGALAAAYRKSLAWALRHKTVTFGAAVVLLAASFALVPLIGASFLPEEEQKFAIYTYSPNPGDRLEVIEQRALDAESAILDLHDSDLVHLQYSIGGTNPLQPGNEKTGLFFLKFRNETERWNEKRQQYLALLQETVPEGSWSEMDMTGGFGGRTFSLSVYGQNLEEIRPVVERIAGMMEADDAFDKVETSLSKTYDQYTIAADQAKLSRLGLTAGQIAMEISPVRARPVLAKAEVDGETYNVTVKAEETEFASVEDLKNATIPSPLGLKVPIGEVAAIEAGKTQGSITRQNGRMVVTVSGEITEKDVAKASSAFLKKVDQIEKPNTVDIETGGVTEQINETFSQLGFAMAAAVAIVYLVLVLTFGGALAPFAVMFSLPFAVIGGLAALWLAGETLSVSALMGALMLIGIVVTNAIVLIDRVIHKEKEGLPTRVALIEAAGTRLRPILMTAIATIGALLPLVFGLEGAGIISRGLGVTVIGGLISSTLLTLFIVPIVYDTLMNMRGKRKRVASAQ